MKLPALAQMTRRQRWLAFAAMAVVGVVLMDRVLLAPWWHHLRRLEQDITTLESDIRTQQALLSRAGDVAGLLTAHAGAVRMAGNAETEIAGLIREIQSLAAKSGVTVGAITPRDTVPENPYLTFALEVQYNGRLQQAVHFLHLLEGSPLVFKIERATWDHKDKDVDRLEGTLRLSSSAMDPALMPLIKPEGVGPS